MKNLYQFLEEGFATYHPNNWGNIKIWGTDVVRFLQGQTTNDVDMQCYGGQFSCLLDVKAHPLALLFIYRVSDKEYFILAVNRSTSWLKSHLKKFIIMDDVQISSNPYHFFLLCGAKANNKLQELYDIKEQLSNFCGASCQQDFICKASFVGGDGYVIFTTKEVLIENKLDKQTFDTYRLERGIAFYGQEFDETNLLNETNLHTKVVNYNKGCFTGQEIVARVKSRGGVNRSLVGLIIQKGEVKKGDLFIEEKKVGFVVNHLYSYSFKKQIAYAYLNKTTRAKTASFFVSQDDNQILVKVSQLPFITEQSFIDKAKKLFEEAMKIFAQKEQKQEKRAVELLRQAIVYHPTYADAYEALGVILSRQQKYDEAIALMKRLKELSPNEVMAYSNLSVFYMKKSMIKEAEEEKAKATLITFQNATKQRKQRLEKEQKEGEKQREVLRKIKMFEEVLELDENDLLANYSLGKCYFDLGKFARALPYLEKAILVKKNYSSAYLYLGKCLLKLKRRDEAVDILQKGLQIATENADLILANEIKLLLRG